MRSGITSATSMGPTSVHAAYQRYFPLIRAKCQRMLSDTEEAQDVAQETFVRLWKSGLMGHEPGRVTAWVYCTSTRLVIDRLRQRKAELVARSLPADLFHPTPLLETRTATRQQLQRLAQELPKDVMEFLIMERLDGLTQEELAQTLGVSTRTVRRLSGKAEQRLTRLRSEIS